jgi:sodium transport system permease protein
LYHASHASAVEPSIAAMIVMAAMATYLAVPLLVPTELGLVAAQTALTLVPIAAVVVVHRVRPLAALGLRGARPRFFIAAVAIGMTSWYLNMRLVALLPLPARQTLALAELVHRPSFARALAMFALIPAMCEEILFRGVLARALGRSLSIAAAAAISGVVFAAYHLSAVQALPTLTLGFVLALIAIRADSVLPAMLAHAINNALAIAISREELPALWGWLEHHPTLALAGCATATAGGIALAVRGPA